MVWRRTWLGEERGSGEERGLEKNVVLEKTWPVDPATCFG